MSNHESATGNLQFDYRTGRPTAISGREVSESQRAACAALNRQRTRAIRQADQEAAPREPPAADVWAQSFARRLSEWDLPFVPLEHLGIIHDDEGFLESRELLPLTSGAEASPFFDEEAGVVYKLFFLRERNGEGALGKKLSLEQEEEGEYQVELRDADLAHTLTKLSVLNELGGHPTEIVGLAESGDYLIAKQPLAFPYEDYEAERQIAVARMRGIVPSRCSFRQSVVVAWIDETPWLIGDLHKRNIMRDSLGKPCVIDALIGSVPPAAINRLDWLPGAIADAREFRITGEKPRYDLFDGVDDDEL